MTALTLTNVNKSFGNVHVLKDINIEVNEGEFVVFVGPSGCGKSTLLRTIAGLEDVTSGEVCIAGNVVNQTPPSKRGIAMVFQSYALYPHLNVRNNMSLALKQAKESKETIEERVAEASRMLSLGDYLDRFPSELSGGQRQRVAIARALAPNPKILLLDEPTSALDVSVQAEILNLLKDLQAEHDLTYVMVSHDLAVVAHMCDAAAVMRNGEIVEILSIEDMRAGKTAHDYTMQLLNASANRVATVAAD